MYHAFLTQTIPLSNQIADKSRILFGKVSQLIHEEHN